MLLTVDNEISVRYVSRCRFVRHKSHSDYLESHQGLGGEGLATDRCRHDAFIVTGCSCDVTALVSVKYIVANTLHVVIYCDGM